ncbi:MAG TPA: SDR family oxidoreductase [Mycobacterium sp.]|nr:SDR family oxidoreductase [Mycobacterium sp.]
MFDLQSKSVVVTGGSKGIGRGIASVFADAGANVAIAARSGADLGAAVADLDSRGAGRVLGVQADVSDPVSCANLAATVVSKFGGIDVVCANAGIFPDAPLATMTPAQLVLDVNVTGNIFTEGLADMGEEYISGMTRAIPAGKLGKPADIGYLAAFLATREAGYITGQAIAVDGGQVLPESPDAVSP